MNVFQKVSRWVTDKSNQFVRGEDASMMQEEPQYDLNEGFDEAYEQADTERRRIMDPFGDGDREYGGRVRYRSQTELQQEAQQQAALRAQQEAEALQAQQAELQAQYQQQMQQTGTYPQADVQQAQLQAQYQQMQQTGTYPQADVQQAQLQAQYQQMQQTGTYSQADVQQAQMQAQQQPQYQQQPQGYGQEQQYAAQQAYTQGGNVLTFPGMQSTADGTVYAHVEYIVQLTSRNECRTVIDYIRSNASVFLNMEAIDKPSERQRCVDMLSGAAYALGCVLNRISPNGVYLISSPSVRVMMDAATQRLAAAPEVRSFARQSYEPEPNRAAYAPQQPMQEEQRVEGVQTGGFSSGSPTQRFQSQGAQGMPVSFSTAMAGSLTSTHRAVQARYNAQ